MDKFFNMDWKWEDMCGPSGLQPWNETSKDFGICFQKLYFEIPVYFLIAVVSAYYVGYRKDWVIREKTQERAIVLRSFVVLALVFIPIIEIYIFITNLNFVLYPVDYFSAGAACLSWLVHFGYILALKHRLGPGARGPLLQLVLWGLSVIIALVALRTCILNGYTIAYPIANLCCHATYFLTLLPSSNSRPTYYSACLVGSQHTHSEYTSLLPHLDEDVLGTAMQGAGFFSKLSFSWVNSLIKNGLQNKLSDPEELFDLPAKYHCEYIGARLDRALVGNVDQYQQFTEVPHEPFIASGYGSTGETAASTPVTPTSRVLLRRPRRYNVSLLRALHTCFGVHFYSIGILKLIADMSGFAGPLLLNRIVTFVEDPHNDPHWGYIYALALLTAMLGGAMFNVHFNWQMAIIGIKMRGALVSTILSKTLAVSSTKLMSEFTVGEITNFMSTDTDRIVNSCPSFHALWSIPLQLFITLFLLYSQVGISFLAGVAFSVILIPINKMVANKIGHLSTEMMRHKDSRVGLVTDMLRGIQTIKVHVWEDYFIDKVNEARTQELRYLRGRKYLDAICVVLWATTPVLVAALTLATHSLRGRPLDAATVFTTVALVNMLISPLNAFPWVLNGITEAWVSIKRIQKLLDLNDINSEEYYDEINTNFDEDKAIIFKNASFSWAKIVPRKITKPRPKKNKGKSKRRFSREERTNSTEVVIPNEPFTLRDINLEISKGELLCIMGSVGSGKSSLLMAIMGEMVKKNGSLQMMKNLDGFGYVAQKAWLVRGTIRDNILFGSAYDESKFKAVVHACALTEDLNVLGWNAYVGEGGCTLSGGQKTRIALARAVYQDKEVYLLDDILSGLDGTVSAHIMRHCIMGALRHKTRILVTHNVRHVTNVCVVMNEGVIAAHGPPDKILHEIEDFLPSESESMGDEPVTPQTKVIKDVSDECQDSISRHSLENEETMAQGVVGWWVLGLYLRSVGVFLSITIILSLILMQLSQNLTFLWLAYWVKSRSSNSTQIDIIPEENMTLADHGFKAMDNIVHTIVNSSISLIHSVDGHSASITTPKPIFETQEMDITKQYNDRFYLEMYFGLAALNLLFTVIRAFLFAYGGVKAAERIHKVLVKVIIKAKMQFFDITPIGRIVNRFSSDTYTVDDSLPFIMNILLAQFFGLIGALAVTLYSIPWLLTAVIPMILLLYYLQKRYRVTSRQLKRLQSVTLSPVYAHFSDTIEGLCTVRALGSAGWQRGGCERAGRWQRCGLGAAAVSSWLAARLQPASAAAASLCCLLPAEPGLIGLALSYALSVTSMLSGVLNAFTETEREMIAVERVAEYIREVEIESSDGAPPPYGWPSHGVIEFQDVSLKYTENSPNALTSVSFSTGPGEKLGVCGRTGAGKSSILRAILKLAPVTGQPVIDGIDVTNLPTTALRSRIGVIPQEPFIFTGTIRENLDPLQQYLDNDIMRALEGCGARAAVAARGGLTGDARGLSRGVAQLICVARATLQRPKILLVDEATANLDTETERLILETIQNKFSHATVIFIAHRVANVLQCDRVLVLGGGKVLDIRPPHDALSDRSSPLYMLVNGTESEQ